MGEAQGKKVDPSAVAAQAIEAQPPFGQIKPRRGEVASRAEQDLREKTWRTSMGPHKTFSDAGEGKETLAYRKAAYKCRSDREQRPHDDGAARGRQFVSAKAVAAHLRYLERDGVTRDGEKGQVYAAERDVADGRAFLERGRDDRHQFRFIVSAEDGVELSDPRAATRDLMRQMEVDLCTRLDWVAVDHHNTAQ
jgi:hypothetical protein